MSGDRAARLRRLPAVDQVLREVVDRPETRGVPRPRLTALVREVLEAERRRVLSEETEPPNSDALAGRVLEHIGRRSAFSLRPVINATGVVLHTNLGRAPLSALALERVASVAEGYSNLELDLASKERGSRYAHVEELLRRLTGAEDALVVNNNAAAVLLALETLAHGKEVVVSRGELIEIGGEFRIPDIMMRSGAVLREVGATNRTHLKDYVGAIGSGTALLLKVHTSNYRVVGFTADVSSRELVALGRERGLPVMEDLGSGSLVDLRRWGFPYEPTVQEVVGAGVDLVSFSGDKLLGGPQAGIVVGRRGLVERLKKNPWNRALRIDKLTLAALEATLYAYDAGRALETVPTLQLLTEPLVAVRRRAQRVLTRLGPELKQRLAAQLVEDRAQVGGGALPTVELPTVVVALGATAPQARALDEALRRGSPPALGRIVDDRLFLDCRTVLPAQVNALAAVVTAAADATASSG
ncbi:MAG: L-seryl-tRNA(Sec) selenium transferase [Candidatus Rokuibacteriota bacterium]|nr:MAG: L-seryl-tRNA(Sec) selenium transferase [Candidatus Rokubacteria bacterium]